MDTLLYNGDFAVDGRGYPIPCTGSRELLQQALIRLTVQQGSFAFDPQLGSRLHTLRDNGRDLEARALELVREALLPLSSLTPAEVSVQMENGGEKLRLTVLVLADSRTEQLEVRL